MNIRGAVAILFYALSDLHFEPTLADLQASSTAYMVYNLFYIIYYETRTTFY